MPDERYFSIPSAEVGGDVRRNRALNCWPWVRSLTHSPEAVIHSPAEMVATWPTTVTTSRCPRALARRTQNHSRHCNRLFARRGPPALPGSMVLAVDSCGLSRSCVAPIKTPKMCLEFRRGRVSDICSHTAAPCKSFGNRRRSAHKAWSSSKSMPVRTRLLDSCWTPTDDFIISILFYWRSLGDSNPCFRRKKAI
jgi:hypothetical protein